MIFIFKEILKLFYENEIEKFKKYDCKKYLKQKQNIEEINYYNEKWKKIKNFNYEISNYGRIRNLTTKKLKQQKFNMYGMQVILWNNSCGYTFTISRLVANYFIKELKKNERVIHKNKNIRDNYYKNLYIEVI